MMSPAAMERLHELCADRALVGLDETEERELADLLEHVPGFDFAAFERAAAATAIAGLEGAFDALPPHLAARIEQEGYDALPTAFDARPKQLAKTHVMPDAPPQPQPSLLVAPPAHWQASSAPPSYPQSMQPAPMQSAPMQSAPMQSAPSNVVPLRPASKVPLVVGWLAAAACFLLAIGAVVVAKRANDKLALVPVPSATPLPEKSRAELLAKAGSKVTEWTTTKDATAQGASGDVVWNANEQRGYMRFRGLAKNDRNTFVYQLWIFDKNRDDKFPVDGGVFDVDANGDVIVPIKAALPVQEVALFAVTVEKPGGVVVSKRERIVVTAKPNG